LGTAYGVGDLLILGWVWVQMLNDAEGVFEIVAESQEAVEKARQTIYALVEEPEIGRIYRLVFLG